MKYKKCPYCRRNITYEKGRQFSAHCNHCTHNPNYKKTIEKIRRTKTLKRNKYHFICKKCGKKYVLTLSINQYKRKKYRKHCSRNCANSRIRTKKIIKKISKSLTHYYKNNPKERKKISNRTTNQWKNKEYRKLMETKYLGKTYEERYGIKKANELKYKKKKWNINNKIYKNFLKNDSHQRHNKNELKVKPYIEKYFNTKNLKPERIIYWFDFVNSKYIIEYSKQSLGIIIKRFSKITNDKREKYAICHMKKITQFNYNKLKKNNVKYIPINKITKLKKISG